MRVISLFAGVGMFDYAWHKLGWETVAFAEQDKWCQKVLKKHYPGVTIYNDVKEVTYERLRKDGIVENAVYNSNRSGQQGNNRGRSGQEFAGRCKPKKGGNVSDSRCSGVHQRGINGNVGKDSEKPSRVSRHDLSGVYFETEGNKTNKTRTESKQIDLICGGFPCQDMSHAGRRAGIEGERSGLWSEFARIIGDLCENQDSKPIVIIENVGALLTGSTVTWFCECGYVGAEQKRYEYPTVGEKPRGFSGCPDCTRELDAATTRHFRYYWWQSVLRTFAEIGGYEVEWHVIPAGNLNGLSAGAPHRRERAWFVAYPDRGNSHRRECQPQRGQEKRTSIDRNGEAGSGTSILANTKPDRPQGRGEKGETEGQTELCGGNGQNKDGLVSGGAEDVENPGEIGTGSEPATTGNKGRRTGRNRPESIRQGERQTCSSRSSPTGADGSNPGSEGLQGLAGDEQNRHKPGRQSQGQNGSTGPEDLRPGQCTEVRRSVEPGMGLLAHGIAAQLSGSRWLPEPGIGRVALGVPDRVNKLKALGNGLCWQIPYSLGLALLLREQDCNAD